MKWDCYLNKKMKNNVILKLKILLCFCFVFAGINAQETISTSGGSAFGSAGSVTYTVGQIVYTTYSDATGSVSQGVQQPYEISIESESSQIKGVSLQCSVYPNPVVNLLTLKVENFIDEKITCYLYDVNAKILLTKSVEKKETSISVANLSSATYYLKVVQMNQNLSPQVVKVFKIIKK